MCPECGGEDIIFSPESGEQVCTTCGLVIREIKIDRGPEWRAYTLEENAERSRVGSPISILQPDKGLPTIIKDVNRDAFGRKLPGDTRLKMLMLRRIQSQHRTPVERNLSQALAELDRIADILHIPESVKEEAAEIYRKALEKD
ncbi:MAG: transcription initiation factor IIB family protein, partial [Candidatus Bathyarchaeia archaeon]